MPRLDGFGLLARVRDEYPETSVILLTGQGSVEDAVRSVIEEGAFYYFDGALQHHFKLAGVNRQLGDRKSTRLNSSHLGISYAVFCLKKKNTIQAHETNTS